MLYAFTKMLEKNASIMCKFKGYRLVTFSSRIQDSTGKICRIQDSMGKNLPDCGIRIPLHVAIPSSVV